jgi:DNA repair protein RAD16
LEWNRVILDEAHRIKARSSGTAYAASALKACNRWCLTGTPLQNRLGDLYSMLRFLRWSPWALYLCSAKRDEGSGKGKDKGEEQGCRCRRTTFDFGAGNRKCPECGHAPMRHYSYFNRAVLTPIQRYGYRGMGRLAFRTLRGQILAKGVLRRTKQERQAELQLPHKQVVVRLDPLSAQELDFYNSLYRRSHAKFSTYVASGTLLHNYAHVFDLLSALRQACDHPYLVLLTKNASFAAGLGGLNGTEAVDYGAVSWGALPSLASSRCGMCNLSLAEDEAEAGRLTAFNESSSVIAKCGHRFHRTCLTAILSPTVLRPPPVPAAEAPPEWPLGVAAEPLPGAANAPAGKDWPAEDQAQHGSSPNHVPKCPRCGSALSVDMRAAPAGFRARRAARPSRSLLGKVSADQV